jgi:hypothetical protein
VVSAVTDVPAAKGVAELLGSTDSDDKLAQRYYIGDPGDFADIYSLSYSFHIRFGFFRFNFQSFSIFQF